MNEPMSFIELMHKLDEEISDMIELSKQNSDYFSYEDEKDIIHTMRNEKKYYQFSKEVQK